MHTEFWQHQTNNSLTRHCIEMQRERETFKLIFLFLSSPSLYLTFIVFLFRMHHCLYQFKNCLVDYVCDCNTHEMSGKKCTLTSESPHIYIKIHLKSHQREAHMAMQCIYLHVRFYPCPSCAFIHCPVCSLSLSHIISF